jgi:mitochondrial-processing peptidase subunit alpha
MMYQAATFNSTVEDTVALLAEAVRDPLITPEEVEVQVASADYEINEIWSKPELILPELVNHVAWQDNTLGMPLLCPSERLSFINRDVINAYRQLLYRPERIVIAFAGIPHEEAVRLTEKWFGDMPAGQSATLPSLSEFDSACKLSALHFRLLTTLAISSSSSSSQGALLSKIPGVKNLSTSVSRAASALTGGSLFFDPTSIDLKQKAVYTGGLLMLPATAPPSPMMPTLSHIYLAFEAASLNDPDIYAVALLQSYLGGGSSFSAGGPGKGMFSRLYTSVLNNYGWVDSCQSFNSAYADSGLLGISASVLPDRVPAMLDVMCRELHELKSMAKKRGMKAEFQRAKNLLKSSLLMNLESQVTAVEDLGRQIQLHGRKVGPKEMIEKLDKTTLEDVQAVANKIFDGKLESLGAKGVPTVVIQEPEGWNSFNGGWDEIRERIGRWNLGRR